MKKIKLTGKEKKACRDVIATWKKKEKRLLRGDRIKRDTWGSLIWASDNNHVVESACSLCDACERSRSFRNCSMCPYATAYNYECYGEKGHLTKFEDSPNLRTCRACIRAVQRILDNAK